MRTPLRRTAALGALALVASLVALAAPTASQPALGDCTPGSDWPGPRSDLAAGVLAAVNAHRATVGAPALAVSSTLSAAAVWKARHMAMYGYMAHDDPAPPIARTTADRLAACGYSGGGWGENIAYGYPSADAVMQGWLASPGHRANIEQPAFLATGIGAAVAPNGAVYWAETFGTSTAGTPPPPPPPPPPPTTTTTATPTTTTTTTALTTTTTPETHARPPAARPAAPRLHVAVGPSPDRRGPRADRRFVLRFPVSPSAHAAHRGVTCRAHVGRVLASGFGGGYAHCVLVAPRGTKGRRVWGTVEVRVGGVKVRRWFSRLVR